MPEIEREKVRAMLQQAPPEKREAIVIRLKQRGFTVSDKSPQQQLPIMADKLPTIGQRVMNFAKTEGPPIAGGMIGGTLGAVGGPPGAIAGAALGGAAGRAFQKIGQYAGGRDPLKDTALGNAAQIGASGIAQGAGEAGGLALGAAGAALKPAATTAGGQILKLIPKVAQKYGQAVLNKPKILIEALSKKDMGAAYQAFERYTGLKGLGQQMEEAGKLADSGQLTEMVLGAANKVKKLLPVSNQELYSASQAVNHLKLKAKFRDPTAASALESGVITRAKQVVEEELQKKFPEYGPLRMANFESKAKSAFMHLFPQNLDQTPAALRTLAAGGLAGSEALKGNYKPAAALPLLSPAVAGLGIGAGAMAAPAVGLGAGIFGRSMLENKAQQMARALMQARQGNQ